MALLHDDLTYKIRGCCFRVHNDYGGGHKEMIYQRALAEELEASGVKFVREPRYCKFSQSVRGNNLVGINPTL